MVSALKVSDIVKSYAGRRVVDGVSFEVAPGDIFGLLGPNGSGKTTTIRLALDILKADSGSVSLFGKQPDRDALVRVGYLPEERGLPRKERLANALRYIARLKGLSAADSSRRVDDVLRRLGLFEHRDKKVEALSRGMTQLAQFGAAIMHTPDLLILDEPFAGLDPINVQTIKGLVTEHRDRGAAVIFSTHIMADVEELCERVALIAEGRMLLYGKLAEIKRSRKVNGVRVRAAGVPPPVPGAIASSRNGTTEYRFETGVTSQGILKRYLDAGCEIESFDVLYPTLTDIFIEEVRRFRQERLDVGPVAASGGGAR